VPYSTFVQYRNDLTVSPNGYVYVKPHIRVGVLPRMLAELLETRAMIKKTAKTCKDNAGMQRILDSMQMGLKLIANVTYGYTAASFTGHMPFVELADSIVQSGREILERSIQHINSTYTDLARVVYGDTDSVFVYMPGQEKKAAFEIGVEMVERITAMNPTPIKLKFEKVYLPCVLLAKKRYVGFKYETLESSVEFEAKGIETIRRDGCMSLSLIYRSGCSEDSGKQLEDIVSYGKFIKVEGVFNRRVDKDTGRSCFFAGFPDCYGS
jgi:DNA polymerase zeta